MYFSKLIGLPLGLAFVSSLSFAAAPATPPLTTIVVNKDSENMVADSIGKTLYVFDLDQNQPAPTCVGDCAELWPPYILTVDEVAGLQAPLGAIERANKKMQLTYNGRPVYTYGFDRIQGDELGDGIGGVWHYVEAH